MALSLILIDNTRSDRGIDAGDKLSLEHRNSRIAHRCKPGCTKNYFCEIE